MGFFGNRKDFSKDHPAHSHGGRSNASPQPGPKRTRSRIPRLEVLFADDMTDTEVPATVEAVAKDPSDEFTAPTIDMDDIQASATAEDKCVSAIPAIGDGTQDDRRKLSSASTSPMHKNILGSSGSGRQDALMRRAKSISRLVQRDSIKRSVSQKIARSESRRQSLLTPHSGAEPRSIEHEQKKELSSSPSANSEDEIKRPAMDSSPCSLSMVTGSLDNIQISSGNDETDTDFEKAYGENDIFLVEEATPKDFELRVLSDTGTEALVGTSHPVSPGGADISHSSELAAVAVEKLPEVQAQKPAKARKRPPPLLTTNPEKSSGDSMSDWPHTTMFGKDGGFATGGFKITQEGMVGLPALVTREDSDAQADDGVPQSDRNLIVVRCLKELLAGPTIGAGAAGRVYLADHVPSKRTMAVKVVNVYDKEKRNQLLKELETLCTYVSRHLVRFYGAFYDGSGAVHIALEYMDHGCLSTFIQRVGQIPESVVQMIAVDCLRGLRFLHRNHVLHRDFKTANILLSRRLCCAKLSDFGLARDLNPGVSRVETFVGTVAYMSPERLQGSTYTYGSDIWAVGVSLVECLMGRYPFEKPQNYFDYIEATTTANMWAGIAQSNIKVSSEAKDFMMLCTQTEPTRRPTAEQLLQHPWITNAERDSEMFGSWLDHCRIISMRVPAGLVPTRRR